VRLREPQTGQGYAGAIKEEPDDRIAHLNMLKKLSEGAGIDEFPALPYLPKQTYFLGLFNR
jgi:hypothetical protein